MFKCVHIEPICISPNLIGVETEIPKKNIS